MKKYLYILYISFLITTFLACNNEVSIIEDSTKVNQVIENKPSPNSVAPTGKTETEKKTQGDVSTIRADESEDIPEEIKHNPEFKECAKSRKQVGGRGGGNQFDYNLCIYDNMRTLVNRYFKSINNSNLDDILRIIDEDEKSSIIKFSENQINQFYSNNTKLTWVEENEPRKTGSRNMSMYINVFEDKNNLDRWLISFTELGKKGSGLWVIKNIQEKQ
ncbi:MAG: hypothetical protein CL758_05075 [Chloroflexi bacterium]|nr:hypothetical protein [Chloroflexota bacterium]|tara:strand:+ start:19909 stop:20562 length:654 start_codon:yes stop_codon:yes gene_type:complete